MDENGRTGFEVPTLSGEYLDWREVWETMNRFLPASVPQRTMNCIHYMHDKYNYERIQMALIDSNPRRHMAFGVAGLSVVADSLSAIRYAKVNALRDERGIATAFEVEGDFPCFGNDDDRVDGLAVKVIRYFYSSLAQQPIYRNAKPTMSILTITLTWLTAKAGATPDGEKQTALCPGPTPCTGGKIRRLAAMRHWPNSLRNLSRRHLHTFSITPRTLVPLRRLG